MSSWADRFGSRSRREMLTLGGLLPVGLGLSSLLGADEKRASRTAPAPRAKSCLLIFLEGGPSHIDMWDMKPDAPDEVRGEFRPIPTRTPGVMVCDRLPLLARQMHHFAQVRSVHHAITDHNAGAYYALTGKHPVDGGKLIVSESPKNFPPFGAVLSKLRPSRHAMPDFVHIPELMSNNNFDIPGELAGFLGAAHDPLIPGDPSLPDFQVPGLSARADLGTDRLTNRDALLRQIDTSLASLAESPAHDRLQQLRKRAAVMLADPAVRRAFDLSQEPIKLRERYGIYPNADRSIEARKFGGLPHLGQCALLARRLLEAGVRLVTLITGRRIDQAWDTHRQHFDLMKESLLPPFDLAASMLMEDLEMRGMLKDTLVVMMGEFGRTPRLGYVTSGAGATKNGRDHWPYCYTVLFAGAGVSGGAVIGASDRQAGRPSLDPVTPEDIAATIYSILGIAPETEIHDLQGKPYALSLGRVIKGV